VLQSGKYSVFPGVPTMFHYLLQRAQEAGVNQLGGTRLCHFCGAIHAGCIESNLREALRSNAADGYGITKRRRWSP